MNESINILKEEIKKRRPLKKISVNYNNKYINNKIYQFQQNQESQQDHTSL